MFKAINFGLRILLALIIANYSAYGATINLTCEIINPLGIYMRYAGNVNVCNVIENIQIRSKSDEISVFNVDDLRNVKGFAADGKIIFYIPKNFGKIFSNSTYLEIKNSKLKEITAENLQNFSSLQYIDLSYNQLTFLQEDLFRNLSKLQFIIISNNNIQYVHPKAFQPMIYAYLDVRNNSCISSLAETGVDVDLLITLIKSSCPFDLMYIIQLRKNMTQLETKLLGLKTEIYNMRQNNYDNQKYKIIGLIAMSSLSLFSMIVMCYSFMKNNNSSNNCNEYEVVRVSRQFQRASFNKTQNAVNIQHY